MTDQSLPKPRALWSVKLTRRLRAGCKLFLENAFAPFFDKQSLLTLFGFFFSLYFIFSSKGILSTALEIHKDWKDTIPFIYAYPLYLVFCLFWSISGTIKAEKERGHWAGKSFIYNEPILLKSAHVSGSHPIQAIPFKIEDCEWGGWVEVKVKIEGFERNVKILISSSNSGPQMPWEHVQAGDRYMLAFVPEDKTFYLSAQVQNTNSSIVKVYLMSSNVQ